MNPSVFTSIAAVTLLSVSLPELAAQSPGAPSTPPEKPKIEARFFNQNTPFAGEITRGIIVAESRSTPPQKKYP
jgi:hypothetical protein